MAIQFILGASGTGKTNYIYDKMIRESMKEGHNPIVFILPEQSNMAAEQVLPVWHLRCLMSCRCRPMMFWMITERVCC